MTKIYSVPDMHCEHCVNRINTAFESAGLDFAVSLADHTVSVNGCEHCFQKAFSLLEDLGFTPSEK